MRLAGKLIANHVLGALARVVDQEARWRAAVRGSGESSRARLVARRPSNGRRCPQSCPPVPGGGVGRDAVRGPTARRGRSRASRTSGTRRGRRRARSCRRRRSRRLTRCPLRLRSQAEPISRLQGKTSTSVRISLARTPDHQDEDRHDRGRRRVAQQERRPVRDERAQVVVRPVAFPGEALREVAGMPGGAPAGAAEPHCDDPQRDRRGHPRFAEAEVEVADEHEPEDQRPERARDGEHHRCPRRSKEQRDLARALAAEGRDLKDPRRDRPCDEEKRRDEVQKEQCVGHTIPSLRSVEDGCDNRSVDVRDRHLRLLTETIEAVNSTLDLEEVLALVARKVADALGADACFVYLYDERTDELVLRATHGTHVAEMTRRPRMHPGEGITGAAAAERAPVAIPAQAELDPRFKAVPNLPEDEYESILAVPILARERLAGALNVRTVRPREFRRDEIELLVAIAAQVAQTIVHAQLYAEAQRRVAELEALARISEAVSESLYLEESLEAIVKTTMEAVGATGAALVLEDGNIAWPGGRAGAYAVRLPLRWKRRQIGELVCDRDAPFSEEERALLTSIAHHAAVALEHGRAVMRGVLAQEIHHRVKNNLQTVASLLRLQARSEHADPRKALEHSVNRILAIAAVHEALTEQREEDVELAELIDRLRAMLVQGLGGGRDVQARLEPVPLAGSRATALALVFSELLQNALEHGAGTVRIELARRDSDVVLAITDEGSGDDEATSGTGLSIVRALVADELQGSFDLRRDGGTRAEVVFPA